MKKTQFLVGHIDDGFLQRTAFRENEEDALALAHKWHETYFDEENQQGYIVVETGTNEKNENERILQLDLDHKSS